MPPSRSLSGVEPSDLPNRLEHWQRFKTGDFRQKWNSSKLIVREGESAIAPLLELLGDPSADAETHWFTIRALGHFPNDPAVISALAVQINDAPCYTNRTQEQATELSALAIETLAAMGPLAIEVLNQLLEQPSQRLLAAKALNQVRSKQIIPAMVRIANDDDAMVRYYAIDALGSFHSATVTPVLLAALQDLSATVRKAAVMALGRRQDLQAQYQLSQQIRPLLWDIDVAVSCQAALALGRLGADDTISALGQVLLSAHTPLALRIDTVRALGWCCDRTPATGTDQAAHQAFIVLTQALQQFGNLAGNLDLGTESTPQTAQTPQPQALTDQTIAQIQIAIIRILGDLRQSSRAHGAHETLIAQLQHHPPAPVLQAIIMAIASLAQPTAFDALLPLLHHPVDAIPMHTIAALKQLDPEHSLHRVTDYLAQSPPTNVLNLW